jgi:hypothetical protein
MLRSWQSDCSMKEEMMWTDYPRLAKRTSLFAIRERELLAAQDYALAHSQRNPTAGRPRDVGLAPGAAA